MGGSIPKLWQKAQHHSCKSHLTSLSCQATELLDAILEGYPKSKKQFFVSLTASACVPGLLCLLCQRAAVCYRSTLSLCRRRLE